MTLLKSTSFQGSPVYDVDVNAPTFRRVFERAQADTQLVHDRLTTDAEADFIDHRGQGRGALPGFPWASQWLGLRTFPIRDVIQKNGGAGPQMMPFLAFIPRGEGEATATVTGVVNDSQFLSPRVTVYSATDMATVYGGGELVRVSDGVWRARLNLFSAGVLAIVAFEDVIGQIDSVHVGPTRIAAELPRVPQLSTSSRVSVRTPTSAGPDFQRMDTGLFVDEFALNAFITSRVDANMNNLEEYAGAWPAGWNPTLRKDEDNALTPSESYFLGSSRRALASEPLVQTPVISACFGAIKLGGGFVVDPVNDPPTVGNVDGFAPYLLASAEVEAARIRCALPDYPSAANLRWAILVGTSTPRTFADCTVAAQMGTSTKSSLVSPTAIPNSPGGSNWLGLATGSSLAFTRGSITGADFRIFLAGSASGFARTDFALLSACCWFEA